MGTISALRRVAHLKKLAALQQPFLEPVEAADLAQGGAVGNILEHAAAVDQQALLFEQERQGLRPQDSIGGQGAAQGIARFVEGESLQGARDLV